MGKTPKPLVISVDEGMYDWPEILALREQGHTVLAHEPGPDVTLGPACWLMDEAHRKYLPLALAEARKRRYPKGDLSA